MATKKVTFEFPEDAWDGIVASLTEHNFQATIPNPAYTGNDLTIPPHIANPASREEAAIGVIKDFVGNRYKEWASRNALKPVQEQIQQQVDARATEVNAATNVSVE